MAPRYAGVCLLDNPFHIDGIYDYRVPEELDGDVLPGTFVTVPFGTANRKRLALVTELRDTSAYKEHKAVISVCPGDLSLDAEMLGLCAFMKTRTLCTTGDAVRAMIPTSALSRLVGTYTPRQENQPTDSDELSPSDLSVFEYLREHGKCDLASLRRQFGAGVELRLKRLCAKGYADYRVELRGGIRDLTETLWDLAIPADVAERLVRGEYVEGYRLSSPVQKQVLRVLLDEHDELPATDLRELAHVNDGPLKTMLRNGILSARERRVDRNPYAEAPFVGQTPIRLNEEQSAALETVSALAFSGEAHAALLYGVTGSGKTCVMTALIDRLLDAGKGVILLLPEISLTPQSVSIFCARYGSRVAVIHSGLSAGERYDSFCRIRRGEADVVIGTRSAVFAPVRNLGAVIIDEEQEHTYKSDQSPRYHARDIARYRCASNHALMLLASATPSVESYKKAKDGVYTLVRLTNRYGGAKLPEVEIADLRREASSEVFSPFGELLLRETDKNLRAGKQSILFLNRRGYHHFISCRSCGEALLCPNCSVAMTYHTKKGTYSDGELICHWCGTRLPLPSVCPACGSEHLGHMGFGTQRVEEELTKLFPDARLLRMDADTTATKFAYDEMLGQFREHGADILLGTQMVTKGHDFPDVTLVGVLFADSSLYLDDYRASERTFAMLTQVIGRAGRGDAAGKAVIQTNAPDNDVIRLACAQDYDTFYEREISLRRLLVFPPFCDIALLTVTGPQEGELLHAVTRLSQTLAELRAKKYAGVPLQVFGPFEAPVYRVESKYRMRMVIKCKANRDTLALFAELMCVFNRGVGQRISLGIDINPSNL